MFHKQIYLSFLMKLILDQLSNYSFTFQALKLVRSQVREVLRVRSYEREREKDSERDRKGYIMRDTLGFFNTWDY